MRGVRIQSLSISIAIPAVLLAGTGVRAGLPFTITQLISTHVDVVIVAISSFLLGPVALLGICLGLTVGIAVNGFSALQVFTLLLIGGWCALVPPLRHNKTRTIAAQPVGEFLRSYVATATGAVLFSTVVLSWVSVITGTSQFYPRSFLLMVDLSISAVILGGVIVIIAYPLLRIQSVRSILPEPSGGLVSRALDDRVYTRYIITPLVIWFVIGGGIAVFFDALALVPRFVFHQRSLGYLLVLKDIGIITNDGAVIQILLGGVILGLLFVVCFWSTATTTETE